MKKILEKIWNFLSEYGESRARQVMKSRYTVY